MVVRGWTLEVGGLSMSDSASRPATEYEIDCITRLLGLAARADYLDQTPGLRAKLLAHDDNYGSIELLPAVDSISRESGMLVEAFASDSDGIPVAALLHVQHGRLMELEFVREDGNPMIERPAASSFVLDVPQAQW